jgi:hypothetical protein
MCFYNLSILSLSHASERKNIGEMDFCSVLGIVFPAFLKHSAAMAISEQAVP